MRATPQRVSPTKSPSETSLAGSSATQSTGGFGITADLVIALSGVERTDGLRLIETAHQICPYSNATRNNIDVNLVLGGGAA
jgi:lipoyl-dependent peroxiredoxin